MRKYGGLKLFAEYYRLGILRRILRSVVSCICHGRHVKNVYYETNRMVAPLILEKYNSLIQERIGYYAGADDKRVRTNKNWFCWLQGAEVMPEVVKACYNSQTCHLQGRDFVFIDSVNWREYITLPDYIVEKYEKGVMPAAMFSDFIRLELLIRYGGTWIDSTVLCTSPSFNPQMLDTDFFIYQYGKGQGLSNWFITSCTNNPMLMVVRDVLYQYWKDYDVVLNYYIFHLLIGRLMPDYPDLTLNMPYADSYEAISLVHNWQRPFNQKKWEMVAERIPFHKLTWKVDSKIVRDKNNYYNHIIDSFA